MTPLFSGDGLAVVDLLLVNPQLEIRGHAVELLSTLLVHKKVLKRCVRWRNAHAVSGGACFLCSAVFLSKRGRKIDGQRDNGLIGREMERETHIEKER